MTERYLDPTHEAAVALFQRNIDGPVVMLNLLRFRDVADYSATPELAPDRPVTGAEAYDAYIAHTLPFLEDSGGEMMFLGEGGSFLIGPADERWDCAMLVRQASLDAFLRFAENDAYLKGIGHRTAAIEDSRLLPLEARSLD